MSELSDLINGKYKEYVASQVGRNKAKSAPDFNRYQYIAEACGVAKNLHNNYDVGIALATDGLFLGYIAQQFGFPVLNTKMGRRLNGAIWQPIDQIDEGSIKDKRVIVFDNDVVTGRTLKRAERELNGLNPEYLDLLLVYGHTEVSLEKYMKWEKMLGEETEVLGRDAFGDYILDTRGNIPKGFRQVKSLEKDFEPDYEALREFEDKMRGK
jgi:hypoxanthine phosphoribosyltransferase